MNAQDLKNSILQLAIQGKLVEQREEEGTAKELLEKIQCEKKQLVKEGKIKKSKALSEIKDDEIPFDIPEHWKWVRLGELCSYGNCCSMPANKIPKDAWLLDLADIEKDTGRVLNKKKMQGVNSKSSKHVFKAGDVLYSKLRPYLNKVVIADENGYSTSEILPLDFGENIYNRYAQTVLMSPYFVDYTIKCSYGVKMPRLGTKDGQVALFPLPPLEEQKRIVSMTEELLPYVDKYDTAYSEVEELNKKFPENMQKSILQYAVQGKLVEQREEEGTADNLFNQIQEEKKDLIKEGKIKKTKKLPEITEDEMPFDIPKNWKWVYINDVAFVTKLAGFEYTKNIAPNLKLEGIPLFKGKNVQNGNLVLEFETYIPQEVSDSLRRSQIKRKCLLTPYVGTIGNIAIFNGGFKAHLGANVGKIEIYNENNIYILEEFMLYFLRSNTGYGELTKYKKSTAQESISIGAIRNVIFPLPPLEEQKRIVAKIEELLPFTQRLVK